MKKLSSMLALSLALAMVLGMTAFAYVSPNPPDVTPGAVTEGVTVTAVSEITEAQKQDLGEWLEGATVFGVEREIELVSDIFELSGAPVDGKVTLSVEGITAETAKTTGYFALHWENGEWVGYPVLVNEDGTITIYNLTSFSPFVIVAYDNSDGAVPPYVPDEKQKPTVDAQPSNNNNTTTDAGTSPKTGESTSMAMLIVLVSLAGASVLGAKKAFSAR